jgi:AcrR family transcriptional regulator
LSTPPTTTTETGAAELRTEGGRAPRADAARNREKVTAAARKVFAEQGIDAEMSAIAKRAGVGVGTVYRHFPTKADLLGALRLEHFERLADIVEGVEHEELEPWESVEQLIWRCAEYTAEDTAMSEVLSQAPIQPGTMPTVDRLRAATGRLVERAAAAGAIRADATVDDVPMVMCAFGRVAAVQRNGGAVDWRRYLTIVLDGLRVRD